jgi:uncharacterized protein YegJ (DUF2314 family)
MPTVGFVVYFQAPPGILPPEESEMFGMVSDYLDQYAPEPLRDGLRSFLEQGFLSLIPQERGEVPEPPDELIRTYNPGEIEERRWRNATHALYIGTTDLLLPPRVGLWATLATARALASALPGGVIMDPEFPRLMPRLEREKELPDTGQIHAVDHILVQVSHTKNHLIWMTTSGMGRFGLPDIELRDAPPNLASNLLPVVNGVAQWLIERAMRFTQENGSFEEEASRPEYLPLRAEMKLTLSNVRRAYEDIAEEMSEDGPDPLPTFADDFPGEPAPEWMGEGAEPMVRLRLEMHAGQRGNPALVRILPPTAYRGSPGIWLNEVLTELFGSDPQLARIETGDAAMEEAHLRAREELPYVRSRFLSGFHLGEVLHVKHGFPTGEGHEYMWIAVTGWSDDVIRGSLANDPQYRDDLRAGQTVEIHEDEVYDWLIVHADGRTEGAYTNRIIEDQSDT